MPAVYHPPTSEPQQEQPADMYNVSGPATEAEKAYMRQVIQVVVEPLSERWL